MKSEFYLTWSKLYFLDQELGNPNSQELRLDQETREKKKKNHHFQVTIKLCFQYKMITFKLGDISVSLWSALYIKTLCHLVSFKKVFMKDSVRANQRPLCSSIRTMSSGQGRRTGNEPIACASVQGPEMLFQGKQHFKDRKEERKRIKKGDERQKTGIIRESRRINFLRVGKGNYSDFKRMRNTSHFFLSQFTVSWDQIQPIPQSTLREQMVECEFQ